MWQKKSRVSWLTTSYLNTKYFHLSTIIQRRRNSIENILSRTREWLKERDSIGDHMVNFFQLLYTSDKPEWDEELEDLIQPVITVEENIQLHRIPTKEEIKSAMDEIEALKVPGPDGMSVIFYQFYWDTVHMDLVEMVQQFFKSGHLLRHLNHTFIVLIPKVTHPFKVEQYRPISLCNVAYKVISKIITIRLRVVISKIISP